MSKQPTPSGDTGPTWNDVRAFMDTLMGTWGGCVLVQITLAPRNPQKTSYGLWVRVVWMEHGEPRAAPERAAGRAWPTSEHRTMPGLLFRLCHELERKLEDLAHDKAMGGGWTGTSQQAAHLVRLDPPTPSEGG